MTNAAIQYSEDDHLGPRILFQKKALHERAWHHMKEALENKWALGILASLIVVGIASTIGMLFTVIATQSTQSAILAGNSTKLGEMRLSQKESEKQNQATREEVIGMRGQKELINSLGVRLITAQKAVEQLRKETTARHNMMEYRVNNLQTNQQKGTK